MRKDKDRDFIKKITDEYVSRHREKLIREQHEKSIKFLEMMMKRTVDRSNGRYVTFGTPWVDNPMYKKGLKKRGGEKKDDDERFDPN